MIYFTSVLILIAMQSAGGKYLVVYIIRIMSIIILQVSGWYSQWCSHLPRITSSTISNNIPLHCLCSQHFQGDVVFNINLYLYSLCLIIKQAVVGVAGGATRAAMIQHQARRDNMADVAAKDGSQVSETSPDEDQRMLYCQHIITISFTMLAHIIIVV